MNEKLLAKLVITGAGIAVFLTGVRTEIPMIRWTGVALVAVAFMLRFVGKRPTAGAPKE